MAENSGFFDAHYVNGEYDRVYLAEHFARYFASFIGNGIFGGKSNELMVREKEPASMSVKVLAGQAWIDGYWYENDAEHSLAIDVADGVLNRIDSIVVRWIHADRTIRLAIKKGVAATSPAAPTVQRNDDFYELKLADIYVKAGATKITQANITDKRYNTDVCGLVVGVVEQLDAEEFGIQLDTYIQEFMNEHNLWKNATRSDIEQWVANFKTQCTNWYNQFVADSTATFNSFMTNSQGRVDKLISDGQTNINNVASTGEAKLNKTASDGQTAIDNVVNTGTANINKLISDKTTEINQLVENSEDRVDNVVNTGSTNIANVVSTGQQNIAKVVSDGTTNINNLITAKTAEMNGVVSKGQADIKAVVDKGTTDINNLISTKTTQIDNLVTSKTSEMNKVISDGQAAFNSVLEEAERIMTEHEMVTVKQDVENLKSLFIHDGDFPGCYYRMVGGQKEWVNPPSIPGVEYRTTERWGDNAVYQQTFYLATLPNNNIVGIDVEANWDRIISINGFAQSDDDMYFFPFPIILNGLTPAAAIIRVEDNGNNIGVIAVRTTEDLTYLKAYITIKYTKG